MPETLILNGKPYVGAKAVVITNEKGEQVALFFDAVRTINGTGPDENGNVVLTIPQPKTEPFTFVLENGQTVTKAVCVG